MSLAYLKGCTLCNDGTVERVEEFLDAGLSKKKAFQTVSDELTKELGTTLYSPEAIKGRYKREKKKVETTPSKKEGPYTPSKREAIDFILGNKFLILPVEIAKMTFEETFKELDDVTREAVWTTRVRECHYFIERGNLVRQCDADTRKALCKKHDWDPEELERDMELALVNEKGWEALK